MTPARFSILSQPSRSLIALSFALLVTTGCSSSDDDSGGGGGAAPGADFLIQDAPVDDLSSFAATVSSLALVGSSGNSANLLAGNVAVEFLGLQDDWRWLASVAPPVGTWNGIEVSFLPGSFEARADDGSAVAVTAVSTMLSTTFAAPLVITGASYERVLIDLDLGESLSGNVAAPPVLFDPQGSSSSGAGSTEIDEIKGVVQAVSGSDITVNAFVDDDLSLALGEIVVRVSNQTLLLMENKAPFASQGDFFAALQPSQTLLEVHGTIANNGIVQADRIEIEDQNAGGGSATEVEIEGRVVGLDAGMSTFELLIQEVEKGQAIVGPVLTGLGDPGTVTVSWTASTVFIDDDSNQILDSNALVIGAEVDCKFASFVSEPFEASEVELEAALPEFEGFVESTAGLPASMLIRLQASDPAVVSGSVDSALTDVTVDTSAASFSLDVGDGLAINPSQIQPGLRVEVTGSLSGPSSAPTIAATAVEIEPGEFEGDVMSVNAGMSFFQAGVDSIDDPFGDMVVSGPLDVLIDPSAVFEGDATSEAEFFALFASLSGGETLEVEVEGIGTGVANEVLAFEIEVEVD